MKTPNPKPLAKDDALYWDDNGRITCGRCAGASLRFTLRTRSGHRAPRVNAAELAELAKLGLGHCECCGAEHECWHRKAHKHPDTKRSGPWTPAEARGEHVCLTRSGPRVARSVWTAPKP
mgnify:CR=1 FL=1